VDAIKAGDITKPPRIAGVPAELESVLRRALVKDPRKRYSNVDALLNAIIAAVQPPRRWPTIALFSVLAFCAVGYFMSEQGLREQCMGDGKTPVDALPITLTPADPQPTDPPPTEEFADLVRSHNDELAKCLADAKRPHVKGIVRLTFEVAPDGSVLQVRIG